MHRHFLSIYLTIAATAAVSAAEAPIDPARASNTVILGESGVKNLGIRTEEAAEDVFEETGFALGRIEEIPARHAVLSSRIAGRVISIKAVEGDLVEAGQVIVSVESRQPGDPPPVIDLKAPISGLLVKSHVRIGEPVEPDKELLDISDLHEVWAIARVPEHHAGALSAGSRARIRVPALGDRVLTGEMSRFGTAADSASGTIDAVFRVANPEQRLRPGMRAEFDLVLARDENVLSVPRESVQGGPADRHVFVKDFDLENAFVRTPVRTGRISGGRMEILAGVFPGDLVVTTGAYPLDFVGGGTVSIKELLDKAHGHEHNEDGTIKGGGSETGGASPRHTEAAGDHGHPEAAPPSAAERWYKWTCVALGVLLLVSLFGRRGRDTDNHAPKEERPC